MEVCSLFYTPKGKEKSEKVLYLHLSDDTTQDAAAVKCHTEYALNDIDIRGEMPSEELKAVFSIVDGCAVQYRCGTVLHSLAHLAMSKNIVYTRCIQAPGHGKAEVDGEGGEAKNAGQKKYNQPAALPENDNSQDTRVYIFQMIQPKTRRR